jgi:hypothetical protein
MGSAAAFGQGLAIGGNIGSPVDVVTISNMCAFTKLSFANASSSYDGGTVCHTQNLSLNQGTVGNTTIAKGLAENIVRRYTNRLQGNKWATAEYTKIDSITDPDLLSGPWNGNSPITPHDNAITYYHYDGNAEIAATNIPKGKTVIVEIEGKATIRGNITYADTLTADDQDTNPNNDTYNSEIINNIYEIPQVIIFAHDIDIAPHVTQIDAWLMTGLNGGSGTINTCAAADISEDSLKAVNIIGSSCNVKLKVNGPVQAKKLRLLRTHGAGMGLDCKYNYSDSLSTTNNYNHVNQAHWPNAGNYTGCATHQSFGSAANTHTEALNVPPDYRASNMSPVDSATPAEVFNLRADAYLWAYRQVENYSQAFVTFEREVAPRY